MNIVPNALRLAPLLLVCATSAEFQAMALEPCQIQIVDSENGWPVPLVELKTTHSVRFVSDNSGNIAFDLPELMNRETWFAIEGHGYSVPPDGFGFRGVRLIPRAGGSLRVQVDRQLPAKRLGRLTGGGLFAESQKLGLDADWLEQGILGCDSVQNAVHDGRLFWGWGDTLLPNYPLGRFHMIGATTTLQPLESLKPPVKLRFDYFVDDKQTPRNLAHFPGEGPTWLGGYASLPDQSGRKRLVATYSKIRPPLTEYEKGLCVWNETDSKFDRHSVLWTRTDEASTSPAAPYGHSVFWKNASGEEFVLFGDPFPTLRCRATFESWSNPDSWEVLDSPDSIRARHGDEAIQPHRGAIAWNAYLGKWVAIFTQLAGESSYLGEIWYAESQTPAGPWRNAIKVVTHNQYTFYNPQIHPEFTQADSPVLLFEATYTHAFSKTANPTPRCDYNQILYRLDLDGLRD